MAGKGLPTLIRLAKFHVDEKRRVLVDLQAREDAVLAAMAAAEAELAAEKHVAEDNPDGVGLYWAAYLAAWMDRRAEMERQLAELRQRIELARDDLAEAFRQQKTYEITQANRLRRQREEADRKEQAFLDEVGLNTYRRKAKNENGG